MAPHLDPLPADEYPADEWRLVEHGIHDGLSGRMETLFALSNGYLGVRGTYDEMTPVAEPGTFLNGYYESWPIVYPESAYGFATSGQTIVNVPDATSLRIMMNGEELGRPDESVRTLDMRSGILERRAEWRTGGGTVALRSERLVSLSHRNVAAVRWTITTDTAVTIEAHTGITPQQPSAAADADHSDPRRAREFTKDILVAEHAAATDRRMVLAYRTAGSGLPMACGAELAAAGPEATISADADDGSARATVTADLDEAGGLTITKLVAYHTAGAGSAEDVAAEIDTELDTAAELGFEGLAAAQRAELDRAWEITDIRVGADAATQQAVRWNLFQLIQATHCVKRSGVGAKGQTSLGYDGHYFWDMDMFLMPFVTHTRPDLAHELLLFRWDTLEQARRRANEMSQTGALYPWRTINGEEASAFFPAGTAQYHINAAVAYAIKRLAEVAPDDDFLLDHGAEIVLETARLWRPLVVSL